MLAIAVQFLTGRYVATAAHHRNQPEWPPHPARLFSALVAIWADADRPDDDERALLEWLEEQPAPEIHASDADARTPLTHFVPDPDATVVGLSLQERRYARLRAHLEALDDELERAGGDLDATRVVRAAAKVDKERDVAAQVTRVGTTPASAALELLPGHRGRQPRTYPSVTPHEDTVTFVWPDAEIDQPSRDTLDRLLARVVRLGHSSSLVACRLGESDPGRARYVPGEDGGLDVRHVGPGQLDELERRFARHRASQPRTMPHVAARYVDREDEERAAPSRPRSAMSGQLIVFERTSGGRPPVSATVAVTRALRGALMSHAEEPIPEELSGHVRRSGDEDTRPVERPHAAFLALPFVGSRHANGRIMGVGVLLPRDIDADARRAVLRAIGRWEQARNREGLPLKLGADGRMLVARITGRADSWNLRRAAWARPSSVWLTATPIALDRHPGDLWGRRPSRVAAAFDRAAATIAQACRNVGLPEPVEVEVSLDPPLLGGRPARSFPRFEQGRGERRVQRALVHARLRFGEQVAGPIVLGAGRYLGLGLLRPLQPGRTGEDDGGGQQA